MDLHSKLTAMKAAAHTAREKGGDLAADAVDQYWPEIKKLLRERVAPAARSAASNDELIEMAARTVHKFLPLPVRMVIRPPRLTGWFLQNRDRVLAAIGPASGPEPEALSSAPPVGSVAPLPTLPPERPPEVEAHDLGADAFNRGDFRTAAQCLGRSYDLAGESTDGERIFKAVAGYRYGLALLRMTGLGDIPPREVPDARLPIANRIREVWGVATGLLIRADPPLDRRPDGEELHAYRKAMINDPLMRGEVSVHLGTELADRGQKPDARRKLDEALEFLDERVESHRLKIALAHRRLATLCADTGDRAAAQSHARWVLANAPPDDRMARTMMEMFADGSAWT